MLCSSPRIASHKARAIEVLPVPDGPTNRKAALGNGESAYFASTRLALSNPTKSDRVCGRYFSDREAGKTMLPCSALGAPVISAVPSKRLMLLPRFPVRFPYNPPGHPGKYNQRPSGPETRQTRSTCYLPVGE